MRGSQAVLVILLVVASGFVLMRWLLRSFGKSVMRRIIANRPSLQGMIFINKLRDYVFNHPLDARAVLTSERRDAVVGQFWREAVPRRQRHLVEPNLPTEGLCVHHGQLSDGRVVAVVSLPPPQRNSEAYLAAAVFPTDGMIAENPMRARALTRFFYLNRGSGETGRETDLCGWTSDGKQRWYNVGAPTDPTHFAKAIEAKLHELKL